MADAGAAFEVSCSVLLVLAVGSFFPLGLAAERGAEEDVMVSLLCEAEVVKKGQGKGGEKNHKRGGTYLRDRRKGKGKAPEEEKPRERTQGSSLYRLSTIL